MAWNFVFLGTVSLVPFTTSLIAERHDHALSLFVFSLAMSLGGVALDRMWNVERAFFIALAEETDGDIRSPRASVILILVIAVLASTLALFYPIGGPFVWVVFPMLAPFFRVRQPLIQLWHGIRGKSVFHQELLRSRPLECAHHVRGVRRTSVRPRACI